MTFQKLGIFAIAAIAGSATGCGKSLPSLTAGQKQIVQSTLNSMGQPLQSIQQAQTGTAGEVSADKRESHAHDDDASKSDAPVSMAQRLSDAVRSKDCKIDSPKKNRRSSLSSGGHLRLYGDSCPASMDLAASASKSGSNSGDFSFSWNYDVSNDAFRALNDVDSIRLSGDISVSGDSG